MISLCEKDLQDGQAGHQGQHPAVPTGVYFKEPPKAKSTWFLFPTVVGCEYTPVFSTCHCTACRGCYSKCRWSSISCHAVICCLAHDHRTRTQAGHLGQSSLWLVLLFCLRLKSPFFRHFGTGWSSSLWSTRQSSLPMSPHSCSMNLGTVIKGQSRTAQIPSW